MYTIDLQSDYAELYRYNLFIACVGYDAEGEQTYVEGVEKIHREEISPGLEELPIPEGFVVGERFSLSVQQAEALQLVIDVVPNTLPADDMIENTPPFEMNVRVSVSANVGASTNPKSKQIHSSTHSINQWGGANIIVKI